ncbi:uncharacterized protein LOC106065184 isoform X1 [Biomphalaria glabrata]|uniref:Uncharacterized protein LOC106065184 isoform X1 n=1 Tax=Biomphalaria glabrata TaxID=6526 RepID=A0A9W3BC95_BIOGL|nr:uncharacterized protein LOC106065184 isoform X1 [Biomphalaria glabrata]
MSTIHKLVSNTCHSQIATVHIDKLLTGMINQTMACGDKAKTKKDKSDVGAVNALCQTLYSSCRLGMAASSQVPQKVLDDIQNAMEQCLRTHPIFDEIKTLNITPKEIPIDEVKKKLQKYIQLPEEEKKSADYADCDVRGEVRDNAFKICLTINFFTTQNVKCNELVVDTVLGLAVDNSAINVNFAKENSGDFHNVMITRL